MRIWEEVALVTSEGMSEHEAEIYEAWDRELREYVASLLSSLDEREAFILRLAFGIDCEREHKEHEIAQILGLSQQRVHYLKQRALQELRDRIQLAEVFAP